MLTGTGLQLGAVGPAIDPSLFNQPSDHTVAWIMTPRANPADWTTMAFPDQFNQL
jgi:hypothetical protein